MATRTVTLCIVVSIDDDSTNANGECFSTADGSLLVDEVADDITGILTDAGIAASITPTHLDGDSIE